MALNFEAKEHQEELGIDFSRATGKRTKYQPFLRGTRIKFMRFHYHKKRRRQASAGVFVEVAGDFGSGHLIEIYYPLFKY